MNKDFPAESRQIEGYADITCASPEELATLRDRVKEAIAEGSPAVVKSLLRAIIHEIRVIDSRKAIQPVFRMPLAGAAMVGDAVRLPSRSVDLSGQISNLETTGGVDRRRSSLELLRDLGIG